MKTFLIIIALINVDYSQNIYSYKAVRVRSEQELKQMKAIDRGCDTFTIFTPTPYKVGQAVEVDK
jgi:hypothetical protein